MAVSKVVTVASNFRDYSNWVLQLWLNILIG